jgi:hypothetical protein
MSEYPVEKILRISIDKYLDSHRADRRLRDYELKAVHCHEPTIQDFAKNVPEGAEAVVEYDHLTVGAGTGDQTEFFHHQTGLALILKKESKE